MPTYPADPNLSAVTSTTAVDPDFLNQFVDNINAIGVDLARLSDNTGNADLAIDKGIAWATTLEIYKSGGELVLDDNVSITGNLNVTGAIAGQFSISSGLDIPGTLTVDSINDSGAAVITFNQTIEMAVGKGVQGVGGSALGLPNGCDIAGDLDVSDTLYVDTINDSGASEIQILEDVNIYNPSGTRKLYVKNSTSEWLYFSSAPYIEFGGQAAPADPSQDGMRIYNDGNGNFKCRLRDGGVTKDKTVMPYAPAAYTVTNDQTDRAYDADTVAVAELADVVGTIIADLQTLGLLG